MNDRGDEWPECSQDYEIPASKREPVVRKTTSIILIVASAALLAGTGGHTVGTHTWSHADLQAMVKNEGLEAAKAEFEKGASAVRMMAGTPIAPFFRFPDLRHPPEMVTYLGQRDVASFSTDVDSWDFKIKKPEELTKSLIGKVRKAGKGIILMHDFQRVSSIALPQILEQLQKDGFKIVHMVPKETLSTLPQHDEAVLKEYKLPTVARRPPESVVRTLQ
jgi:peptidoglycan-N-acetylglucosamine deacetylase